MLDALNFVFKYAPADPHREHSLRLEAVRQQIDATEAGLAALKFPEHLYRDQLSLLRTAFSPAYLNHPSAHLITHLTGEVRLMLLWSAYALEGEGGTAIDAESLAKAKANLEAFLADPGFEALPKALREFLAEHFRAMLDALDAYPIQGGAAMAKTMREFAVDVVLRQDQVDDGVREAGKTCKPLMEKVGRILKQGADIAATAGKAAEGCEKAWKFAVERGPQLLEWARDAGRMLAP